MVVNGVDDTELSPVSINVPVVIGIIPNKTSTTMKLDARMQRFDSGVGSESISDMLAIHILHAILVNILAFCFVLLSHVVEAMI
jgi:hypothetical protein